MEAPPILDIAGQPIEKAQTTIAPPGGGPRFALLGANPPSDIIDYTRRQQYGVYYEMYRQHPVVRAIIDRKSNYAIAGGYRFVTEDPREPVSQRKVDKLKLFFRRSNAKQLLRLTYRDLDIYGESFWFIQRSIAEARTPIKAMRLNPRFMAPIIQGGKIVAWNYGPITSGADKVRYPAEVILHFKLDDPEDDTRGLSPLHSLQRTVATDIFAMDFNENFFNNSATTGTIFVVKSSTGEEAKRNREWLEQNYVGTKNAHRPILLEGEVDIKKSVSNKVEMQYMEGRKHNMREICMVLEMDETRLGIYENASASSSVTSDEAFHSNTIFPRQQVVEDEINNALILAIFGWDDILFQHEEGDPRRKKENADVLDKNLKSGRQSLNEQRAEMGLGPVSGGEIHFLQTAAGAIPYEILAEVAKAQLQGLVAEPVSGVGTDTTGQRNPAQQLTNQEKRDTNGA